jgi:hypothetical protein
MTTEDFSFPLAEDEKVEIVLSGPGFSYAPVVKGKEAGYAYVCIGGETVGKVKLVYGETVERQQELKKTYFWEKWFGERK